MMTSLSNKKVFLRSLFRDKNKTGSLTQIIFFGFQNFTRFNFSTKVRIGFSVFVFVFLFLLSLFNWNNILRCFGCWRRVEEVLAAPEVRESSPKCFRKVPETLSRCSRSSWQKSPRIWKQIVFGKIKVVDNILNSNVIFVSF